LDAGLGAGFIQDIITGRASDPTEQALMSLAAVLKCSPAYLMGHSDELTGQMDADEAPQPAQDIVEWPDAVMALRIIDELLAKGHVDAARLAVKRALKEFEIQ
jgi:hypothetical protein